ncbi:MAG: polyhydroxyalkanoate synthesis repressor PhaR [Proteobacteria bacterium]|nr:polyhydroxyalkanoate synthesis repressor PhaR [Pseudomonadota bacterium]
MAQPNQPTSPKSNPIVIKKYANRRLYNTDTSAYVTLDDLCQMIKEGEEIIVYDAKNGDDITRGVLTQIIVEQESKGGQNLLPTSFLRQLISFYGNNMQSVVPRYLEYSMQAFTKNQSQMNDYLRSTFGSAFGGMFSNTIEQVSKQNMALFENAMRMFSPFGGTANAAGNSAPQASAPEENEPEEAPRAAQAQSTPPGPPPSYLRPVAAPAAAGDPQDDASIRQMQQRLDELQKQIAQLSKTE